MSEPIRKATITFQFGEHGVDAVFGEGMGSRRFEHGDVAEDWLAEAERRDEAMERGEEAGTPAREVLQRLERRGG